MIIQYLNRKMELREHLFWDVPRDVIDPKKSRRLIIERVLTRGTMKEFRQVIHFYGQEEFLQTVKRIGSLDKKTINYLEKIFGVHKEDLKCYKPVQ